MQPFQIESRHIFRHTTTDEDARNIQLSEEVVINTTTNLLLGNVVSSTPNAASSSSTRISNMRLAVISPGFEHQQGSFRAGGTVHDNAFQATAGEQSSSIKRSPTMNRRNIEANSSCFRRRLQSQITSIRFDRFVPIRNNSAPCSERYRTTKDPDKLSQAERLFRAGPNILIRSIPLRQTLPSGYSPFSPQSSLGHGVDNRAGKSTLVPCSCLIRELNGDEEIVQRILPMFAHPLNLSHGWRCGPVLLPVLVGERRPIRWRTGSHSCPTMRSLRVRNRQSDHERSQERVAFALNINLFCKILEFNMASLNMSSASTCAALIVDTMFERSSMVMNWRQTVTANASVSSLQGRTRSLPVAPFKVLDAPNLRDDFYCSVLAYSFCRQTLAVGLGNIVYTWSDKEGVRSVNGSQHDGTWLTSISFSSVDIFAAGRSDGTFVVMSLSETDPRFEIQQSHSIACLSWRPCSALRFSSNPLNSNTLVATEDLVVGDELGDLYYYLVEWPLISGSTRDPWPGSIALVARISIHSQQICGLAWSPSGDLFASGGNDNLCSLFSVSEILAPQYLGLRSENQNAYNVYPSRLFGPGRQAQITPSDSQSDTGLQSSLENSTTNAAPPVESIRILPTDVRNLVSGCERQVWAHQAAVKAIAFCPWLKGLVATGGGSNDKCIHFFHTVSGSSLATISVAAQVTSLIWSNTKREIAATFGYAHPEHPYRIAVFSWPDCSQIAAIPWEEDLRALHAVPYPCILKRSKKDENNSRSLDECIVVASSDKTVKFHEVWSTEGSRAVTRSGMFGGSDILEDLQGIIKEGDIIR